MGGIIGTFANMRIADVPAFINQIQGGPVFVVIGCPGFAVVILRDRICDLQLLDGILYIQGFWPT